MCVFRYAFILVTWECTCATLVLLSLSVLTLDNCCCSLVLVAAITRKVLLLLMFSSVYNKYDSVKESKKQCITCFKYDLNEISGLMRCVCVRWCAICVCVCVCVRVCARVQGQDYMRVMCDVWCVMCDVQRLFTNERLVTRCCVLPESLSPDCLFANRIFWSPVEHQLNSITP